MKRLPLTFVLPALLLLTGCGGGDKSTKPVVPDDGLPEGTPAADSPTHLMQRFEATWESQVEAQNALLLADDFRFVFSAAADPSLANQYPNWSKNDEVAAITHMFDGFVNNSAMAVPGASRIDLSLNGVSYGADPDHPDSTSHYQKVIVTILDGTIEVPDAGYDLIDYRINSRQEFYLVRGDAAVVAGGGDAGKWYIRRWEDLSPPPPAKGTIINPAQAKTLGSIKAMYR